jgi:hypothetical protein
LRSSTTFHQTAKLNRINFAALDKSFRHSVDLRLVILQQLARAVPSCISKRSAPFRLYRKARSGKLEADKAARLIWMLREIRGCLEGEAVERLEEKMAVLQQRLTR